MLRLVSLHATTLHHPWIWTSDFDFGSPEKKQDQKWMSRKWNLYRNNLVTEAMESKPITKQRSMSGGPSLSPVLYNVAQAVPLDKLSSIYLVWVQSLPKWWRAHVLIPHPKVETEANEQQASFVFQFDVYCFNSPSINLILVKQSLVCAVENGLSFQLMRMLWYSLQLSVRSCVGVWAFFWVYSPVTGANELQ